MANEILTTNEPVTVDNILVGRLPIYTSIERFDPTKPDEIIYEVTEAMTIHVMNLFAMEELYWYRRGVTPIYGKEKTVRDEINNKVNVNLADYIVNFKDGFFMTSPCFYISRKEGDEITEKVDKLNEYLYRSGKQTADNKMVDWFHTVGKANLFVQSNDDPDVPFKAYALDPRSAFVVRSMNPGNKPVYAAHTVVRGEKLVIDLWDDSNYYKLEGTVTGKLTTPTPNYICTPTNVVESRPNPLKRIPIIEYYYNSVQMGAFESAVPLLNSISKIQSDRLDGLDQFIQSLLVFYNCELGEDEDGNPVTPQLIRAMGAVFLKSVGENKADLKEISSQLDQSQTQVFIDNLYDQVLTICGMPMIDRQGSRNHATGMVSLVDNGWYQATDMALNCEDLFRESNIEFDEIITSILREKGLLDIRPSDFILQFTRNETANIQSKAQAFQTLLSAGMHPELAASKSGVSNDPVSDIKMSEKYLKMIWGDPDAVEEPEIDPMMTESMGEEYGLQADDERGSQAQANLDEKDWLVNKSESGNRKKVTDAYYRVRNGRKELVRAYKKQGKAKGE